MFHAVIIVTKTRINYIIIIIIIIIKIVICGIIKSSFTLLLCSMQKEKSIVKNLSILKIVGNKDQLMTEVVINKVSLFQPKACHSLLCDEWVLI